MIRSKIALALGLAALAPLAAHAQAPAAKAPATVPGLSPQGTAVIAKIQQQEDPVARATVGKLQALVPQLSAIATAPTVDVEKFAALLKQQDTLVAQLKARGSDRIIAILRALPVNDRGPFLRAIGQRQSGAAGPGGQGR